MPVMGTDRARGIVNECFYKRRYFLRQLTQSLPNIILVFSATTAAPFITALQQRFRPEGAPDPNERLEELIKREIRLEYGRLDDGTPLDARVIFMPHASARPDDFEKAKKPALAHINEEVAAGRLVYLPQTGHLARPRGGCFFCTNSLYRIGPCDYESELEPLSPDTVSPLAASAGRTADLDPMREKAAQSRLLDALIVSPDAAGAEQTGGAASIKPLDAAAPSAPSLVLFGKAVTMTGRIIEDAAIYTARGAIVAIRQRADAAPEGFAEAREIETGGLIYPGLLDLHNHLAYNILPLWATPRGFNNRREWMKLADYRRFVTQPMNILVERRPDLVKSIVRYVEAKLLLGGVTSGQGMKSRFGGADYYHGVVRNFEASDDAALPSAHHRIADLENKPEQIASFKDTIGGGKPFFFHLAEGVDDLARSQFALLDEESLIAANLIGIHCVGLRSGDFKRLAEKGAKVVWSPLSNLLLYGKTLDLKALVAAGLSFSLGSDWTPSGSRNLLLELKVARLAARAAGVAVDARTLVESATRIAAHAAGWSDKLGTLEDGKYADILVLGERAPDPYENLLLATERDIRLVMVAGQIRYGDEALVKAAGYGDADTEPLTIGGRPKLLRLEHPASPLNGLSLAAAAAILREEMSDLARAELRSLFRPLGAATEASIELDLQFDSEEPEIELSAALPPLKSIELDGLTVIDDPRYLDALEAIGHLPTYLKGASGLRQYYV
jgi:cytosine/adenosine deaminase-related metal-dependent hydrolase